MGRGLAILPEATFGQISTVRCPLPVGRTVETDRSSHSHILANADKLEPDEKDCDTRLHRLHRPSMLQGD